ncbi:crossover junction endodeoxyribonuclease RuvC [candidate division KSB1 bacterium]|nr:crossover junction endodeoxyribonuclease RuvC [candidate division KSB1 bacterium]
MIILGVDPGSLATGYGMVAYQNAALSPVCWGTISCSSSASLQFRLKKIYDEISQIIRKHNPSEMIIESLFYAKNAQTALKLGHARGVILLAAMHADLGIAEYSPREVKQALTGNGSASKQQVKMMVMRLLGVTQDVWSFDESDSLAIAICHCHRVKFKR